MIVEMLGKDGIYDFKEVTRKFEEFKKSMIKLQMHNLSNSSHMNSLNVTIDHQGLPINSGQMKYEEMGGFTKTPANASIDDGDYEQTVAMILNKKNYVDSDSNIKLI